MKQNLNKMLVLVATEFDGIYDKGGEIDATCSWMNNKNLVVV